jgi:hypothetical protein
VLPVFYHITIRSSGEEEAPSFRARGFLQFPIRRSVVKGSQAPESGSRTFYPRPFGSCKIARGRGVSLRRVARHYLHLPPQEPKVGTP